jgi:hypothetical protein
MTGRTRGPHFIGLFVVCTTLWLSGFSVTVTGFAFLGTAFA